MKIFYRKSDNKFCGAENIDKQILGNDKVLSIEIDDNEWMEFIQTSQEIYIEKGELVSKERIVSNEEKILSCKNKISREILEKYPLHTQINITNLLGYTEKDKSEMLSFIKAKRKECQDKIKELKGKNV